MISDNSLMAFGLISIACLLMLLAMAHQTMQVRDLYYMFAKKVDADRAGKLAAYFYDKQVTMSTITLGEFLNINGNPEMPLLILVNDGAGNYENPCNDENYGVWTNSEFAKKPYAEKWCGYIVDNAVEMTANGVSGYVLWVGNHA